MVCSHETEPYGSAKSMNSVFGVSVGFPATYTPLISPTYTASRPSSLGNPLSPRSHYCIPLPPYFCHHNPATAPRSTRYLKERHPLAAVVRDRYERASDQNLGPRTILTAPLDRPALCSYWAVTVKDLLLAVHYALRASDLDYQLHRG